MSSFLFLSPWLLAALAALPALWFLLRVMPPPPKRVFLPSARFLEGLVPNTQTPSKTPWWILLLRLMIAALVITAMAQPVMNPSGQLNSDRDIRLIIDNGWSSADIWDDKIQTAQDILAQASRNNVSVHLHTTAPEASDHTPLYLGPFSADEALSRLKGLAPLPWHPDFLSLNQNINKKVDGIDSYYLSDGINARNLDSFIRTLQETGDVHIITPATENLPIVLSRGDDKDGNPGFVIRAPENIPSSLPITLQAQGQNGQVLGIESITLDGSKTKAAINIPDTLKNNLTSARIVERIGAGNIYLFGDQFQKKSVGIAAPTQDEGAKPFIEASFYLTRALEPFSDLITGDVNTLLSANPSVIILPDIGAFSPSQLNRLEEWVRSGGLLLRFAGPAMQQARQQFLIPTPIRQGARSLDGALAWEMPPKLAEFSESSPLSGIIIREDIVIKQQLLAAPETDLSDKSWATLDDGTPLITADNLGKGMIVMVHTTASPDWSNLPLSGVFVQILSRLVKIAGSPQDDLLTISGSLEPIRVLNGQGQLTNPDASTQVIAANAIEDIKISPDHPPGIYGQGAVQTTLNLGDHINAIKPIPDFGLSVKRSEYGIEHETNLMPTLLIIALVLLLIDWNIMLALSGHFKLRRLRHVGTIFLITFTFTLPVHADIPSAFKYADGLYLGFIKSDNAGLNAQTRQGLEALKEELTRRTSAEPDGVVGLDPEKDTLSFFPLLYWPIDANDKALSDTALTNIQGYLDNGGTILFDTREAVSSSDPTQGGGNAAALSRITSGINIPALMPIQDDHVLGKSFYLIDSFPGRYTDGTLWVEGNSENGRDGVSSVLIGSHDWASAWAQSQGRNYRSGTAARQREMSIRFGINLMMYALTGNYKADQVHVTHILERLGQ